MNVFLCQQELERKCGPSRGNGAKTSVCQTGQSQSRELFLYCNLLSTWFTKYLRDHCILICDSSLLETATGVTNYGKSQTAIYQKKFFRFRYPIKSEQVKLHDCRKKYIYMRCYKKLNSKQRNSLETCLLKKMMAFRVMRNKSTPVCSRCRSY